MNVHALADQFLDLTDEMVALRQNHRARRSELARQHAAEIAAMRTEERALSARRAQVALMMTQTGHSLADLGRMVGVSGPLMCQLARRARKDNTNG